MDPRSAPPFEVVEIAGGRLYRLPRRELGAVRWFAITPILIAGFGLAFLFNAYVPRFARGPLTDWQWALFAFACLSYARGSVWLLSIAAAIWCGQAELEVRDDGTVRAGDRAGWFRPRWGRLKPGTLRKLILKELVAPKDESGQPLVRAVFWQLLGETDRGRKVWLVLAYPREVLAALAAELATRVAIAAPHSETATSEETATAEPVPIPVVVEESGVPSRDVLEQPLDSRVRVQRHPDGVTLTVPPLGLRNANGGLVFIGLIFSSIGGIITIGALAPVFQANPQWPSGVIFVGIGFFSVGSVFFVTSLNTGLKKVVLAVVGDRLLTFEAGPLGSRRREFSRDGLRDIACGPSNVSVNNKPLPQLHLVEVYETKVGMLTGRDETELKWIATVLRQTLRMPSEAPEHRKWKPPTA